MRNTGKPPTYLIGSIPVSRRFVTKCISVGSEVSSFEELSRAIKLWNALIYIPETLEQCQLIGTGLQSAT